MIAVEALVKKKLFLTSHLRNPPVAPEEFTMMYTDSVLHLLCITLNPSQYYRVLLLGPALKMSARPLGSSDTQNFFDGI